MRDFDFHNASADELTQWCSRKYKSRNPIIRILYNNYFYNIRHIIQLLDTHDHLLEVGCGPGESSLRIASMLNGQNFEVSEFDIRYIDKLKEGNFPLKLTQESVYQLIRKDKSFDCIFLLEVLEHLENFQLALKELFRVSRKYVVISVPNEPLWRIVNFFRLKYIKDFGNTIGHVNHW